MTLSKHTIIPPTIINFFSDDNHESQFVIEYSIHKCPLLLKSDMNKIFPSAKQIFEKQQLYIIPTFQHVSCPLFVFDEESSKQKDDRLHKVCFIII